MADPLDPRRVLATGDALLIVDVQNDYCPGGAHPVPAGDAVVPVLNRWLRAAREKGIPVFVSRDWHPIDHRSFAPQGGPRPPHCVQGTDGAALHPDLQVPGNAVLLSKGDDAGHDAHSAFDGTRLAERLRRRIDSLRTASYALAIERVAHAYLELGIFP